MKKLDTVEGAWDVQCTAEAIYYRVSTQKRDAPYCFFRNDLDTNTQIPEADFNRAKYHADVSAHEEGEEVVFMTNGDTLRCCFQDSIVRQFSCAGQLILESPIAPAETSIYSLAVDDDGFVWTVDPPFHHIGQYELETGQRLFELGGSLEPGEFDHPEDVSIYGGNAFVSDMGNRRIVILDTNTKSFSTYHTFNQPVWQYRRFKSYEVVRLDDGIYIL